MREFLKEVSLCKECRVGGIMSKQKMISWSVMWCCVGSVLLPFCAEAQEYSPGIKLKGLTISPFVNLDLGYDSNIIFGHNETGDKIYRVNPGVDLNYIGNEWGMSANVWYAHSWYHKYDVKDNNRWGERLNFYRESQKGWKLVFGQGYQESDQNDSVVLTDGDGVWRNRRQLDANVALSYEFNERLSATLHAMYSDMWYDNAPLQYQNLYGWSQWSVGGEILHKLTERSSLILSGSYQEYYTGENLLGKNNYKQNNLPFNNTSRGYSLMGGLASRFTERIRYRALAGGSMYDYAGDTSYMPSYSLDATWAISEKWAATVAGAGYFQPSERNYYQQKTIYIISGGMTYRPIRQMTLTLDGVYRGEDNQTVDSYSAYGGKDYMRNQYTARFKVNYRLQKYASVYSSAEYTYQDCDYSVNRKDEWERYRLTVGLSLRY